MWKHAVFKQVQTNSHESYTLHLLRHLKLLHNLLKVWEESSVPTGPRTRTSGSARGQGLGCWELFDAEQVVNKSPRVKTANLWAETKLKNTKHSHWLQDPSLSVLANGTGVTEKQMFPKMVCVVSGRSDHLIVFYPHFGLNPFLDEGGSKWHHQCRNAALISGVYIARIPPTQVLLSYTGDVICIQSLWTGDRGRSLCVPTQSHISVVRTVVI